MKHQLFFESLDDDTSIDYISSTDTEDDFNPPKNTNFSSESPSNLMTSEIKKYISQELDLRSKNNPDNHSSKNIEPTPAPHNEQHKKDKYLYTPSREVSKPHIPLPKKSSIKRHFKPRKPIRVISVPLYRKLEPLNSFSRSNRELLSFNDKRVTELLMQYESDICLISPVIKSPDVTADMNMKRCLRLIEELKRNDYLYYLVYLTDTEKVILDIIFIVYTFPVKNKNQKREFMNLFDFMIDVSFRYAIPNVIFCEDNSFTLSHLNKYTTLHTQSYKETIFYLCKINKDIVNEKSTLSVNPKCLTKEEYLYRHNNNELCVL